MYIKDTLYFSKNYVSVSSQPSPEPYPPKYSEKKTFAK